MSAKIFEEAILKHTGSLEWSTDSYTVKIFMGAGAHTTTILFISYRYKCFTRTT